jgi:NAD-dependent SIR2 family protein deacetylase
MEAPVMDEFTRCATALGQARRLLVLTGAGVSAESGMPTYRGPGGIYAANSSITAELSAEGLENDPDRVWEHIDAMRIQAKAAEPNSVHRTLAQWEQSGRFERFLIATQNIDGLHQRAGSQRVTELHGSLWQIARPRTVDFTEDEQFSQDTQDMEEPDERENVLRRWSEENQQQIWENRTVPFSSIPPYRDPEVRPNVVLFNEGYGSRLVWVEDFIRGAPDAVLVIGCSGGVTLLARLLDRCRAAKPDCVIININPHEDCIEISHEYLPMKASTALEAIDSRWA